MIVLTKLVILIDILKINIHFGKHTATYQHVLVKKRIHHATSQNSMECQIQLWCVPFEEHFQREMEMASFSWYGGQFVIGAIFSSSLSTHDITLDHRMQLTPNPTES